MLNNSKRGMFPEILPAASSHKEKISCWLLQLQRLWTEMKKLRKPVERLLRDNQREKHKRENREVIDTVGDRGWDWSRKLKGKRRYRWGDASRPILFFLSSLFLTVLLLPCFFFSCLRVSAPLRFSPTSNNPQLFIWSWTAASSHRHTHICACRNKTSKTSRYNTASEGMRRRHIGRKGKKVQRAGRRRRQELKDGKWYKTRKDAKL